VTMHGCRELGDNCVTCWINFVNLPGTHVGNPYSPFAHYDPSIGPDRTVELDAGHTVVRCIGSPELSAAHYPERVKPETHEEARQRQLCLDDQLVSVNFLCGESPARNYPKQEQSKPSNLLYNSLRGILGFIRQERAVHATKIIFINARH